MDPELRQLVAKQFRQLYIEWLDRLLLVLTDCLPPSVLKQEDDDHPALDDETEASQEYRLDPRTGLMPAQSCRPDPCIPHSAAAAAGQRDFQSRAQLRSVFALTFPDDVDDPQEYLRRLENPMASDRSPQIQKHWAEQRAWFQALTPGERIQALSQSLDFLLFPLAQILKDLRQQQKHRVLGKTGDFLLVRTAAIQQRALCCVHRLLLIAAHDPDPNHSLVTERESFVALFRLLTTYATVSDASLAEVRPRPVSCIAGWDGLVSFLRRDMIPLSFFFFCFQIIVLSFFFFFFRFEIPIT